MHHLILGYGYCAYYLAQHLVAQNQQVTTLSRHLDPTMEIPGVTHLVHDLTQGFNWDDPDSIIYYLIPPPSEGLFDSFLKQWFAKSHIRAKKLIYFGSSAVYGDYHGAWVSEEDECRAETPRQLRRLDAEQQCLAFCQSQAMECIVLRVAGIYGPNRLPIDAAKNQTALIERSQAPDTNSIYVEDLVAVAAYLGQQPHMYSIYNIADGHPHPMGSLQELVASALHVSPAAYVSWEQALKEASPMKREFMQSSKRLNIDRLKSVLGDNVQLSILAETIAQIAQQSQLNE